MTEEAVEPQEEVIEQILDEAEPVFESPDNSDDYESPDKKTMVPLTALQKQRQKTREKELEAQFERQEKEKLQAMRMTVAAQEPVEEDTSMLESATKQDLRLSEDEVLRKVEERIWIRQNPEKYDHVTENLDKFLKQRPNLRRAIQDSGNRYEEAYTLMDALTSKQKTELKRQEPKKPAPGSPSSVPKSAVLNDAVDVMGMNDKEFLEWKQSKKVRRQA